MHQKTNHKSELYLRLKFRKYHQILYNLCRHLKQPKYANMNISLIQMKDKIKTTMALLETVSAFINSKTVLLKTNL